MLFLSIYIYLVCNFVVSHFPTGYDVPMGDIVAGIQTTLRSDKRLAFIQDLAASQHLLEAGV